MTSFVPIKLSQSTNIIWQNESPSSTRYCRPIRFEFVHENTEISREEYYRMEEEIKSLVPTVYKNVIVEHEMLLTMIDGKICTAISNTSSCATCPLCLAIPKQMNDLNKVVTREINVNLYNFGVSSLHARIRCMEYLLHVAYNSQFKRWSVRDANHKNQREETKRKIQQEFKEKLGLLIDVIKQGFGLTHDGNTARQFFTEFEISAKITGLDKELIKRFAIILQTISCGEQVNATKFGEFALETAKQCVSMFGWYYMPVSVHKLLMHGEAIISHFTVPIG